MYIIGNSILSANLRFVEVQNFLALIIYIIIYTVLTYMCMYYRVHRGTLSILLYLDSIVVSIYIYYILIHMDHHDILLKNLLDHEPLHSILS